MFVTLSPSWIFIGSNLSLESRTQCWSLAHKGGKSFVLDLSEAQGIWVNCVSITEVSPAEWNGELKSSRCEVAAPNFILLLQINITLQGVTANIDPLFGNTLLKIHIKTTTWTLHIRLMTIYIIQYEYNTIWS